MIAMLGRALLARRRRRRIAHVAEGLSRPLRASQSEATMPGELREYANHFLSFAARAAYIGWVPAILYIGFISAQPRPSIIRLLSPLA